MYIIAKKSEKDYYDGVAGTVGIDKTIVYTRQLIELEGNDIPSFFENKKGFWKQDESKIHNLRYAHIKKEFKRIYPNFAFFIIGFCGKLYIGWKLYSEGTKFQPDSTKKEVITKITYDFDFMKTIVEPEGWRTNFQEDVLRVKNFDAMQLFRNFKAPIFLYDSDYGEKTIDIYSSSKSRFFVNPFFLDDYEFYKVFDAFQAFQEISMFMGGVLGRGEKEIIEVADKYKIQQHGFDKWSFRKMPENKK